MIRHWCIECGEYHCAVNDACEYACNAFGCETMAEIEAAEKAAHASMMRAAKLHDAAAKLLLDTYAALAVRS